LPRISKLAEETVALAQTGMLNEVLYNDPFCFRSVSKAVGWNHSDLGAAFAYAPSSPSAETAGGIKNKNVTANAASPRKDGIRCPSALLKIIWG